MCPDETGYETFMGAFTFMDPVDLHPFSTETYSCFEGIASSRMDTIACYRDRTIAVASYHYRGGTLLFDYHVPLLFTITHPVARLDHPSPHTVCRTP